VKGEGREKGGRLVSSTFITPWAGWIKMPLGIEVGLGPDHIVLDGQPAPPKKGGTALQFSSHVYCGQTVAHISR